MQKRRSQYTFVQPPRKNIVGYCLMNLFSGSRKGSDNNGIFSQRRIAMASGEGTLFNNDVTSSEFQYAPRQIPSYAIAISVAGLLKGTATRSHPIRPEVDWMG